MITPQVVAQILHDSFKMAFPPGESFEGTTLLADGWQYIVVPPLDPDDWNAFWGICQTGAYRLMVKSEADGKISGQYLVSPLAYSELQGFASQKQS